MRLSIFDHVLTPAEAAAAPTAPVDPTAPDVSFLAREPAAALESFFGTINRITTDNPVYGGLGGAGVNTEAISWGKETVDGDNVMVFADVTVAVPFLCQGLLEHYGPRHVRPATM